MSAWHLSLLAIFLWTESPRSAINVPQSHPGVCRLETSWNRCLSPPHPSGRFPSLLRTGSRPRCCPSLSAHRARRPGATPASVWKPWKPASRRTLRPPIGPRRRTRPTRSRASVPGHTPQSGWQTGPSGPSPGALAPTTRPGAAARAVCVWEHDVCPDQPYHTHQVLELPPIAMEVTHWVLHQGWCPDCGRWSKAQVPAEHATGYGPRFSALMGELAGAYGNGRRIVQTFCASVLRVPISLGAIQKVLDRVAQAIEPHYTAIATQARRRWSTTSMKRPGFSRIRCTGCG